MLEKSVGFIYNMSTVADDLIKKLMDDQVVTKTEFSKTIHKQTLDLFQKFDKERKYHEQQQEQRRREQEQRQERHRRQQEQRQEHRRHEQEQKQEQKYAELRTEFTAYRKETKTQTRWLIGIGITLMLGIVAILLRLHT